MVRGWRIQKQGRLGGARCGLVRCRYVNVGFWMARGWASETTGSLVLPAGVLNEPYAIGFDFQ